ncbi:glycoside hydrolase family 47 protein [Macroventuria anomochaeta]|uniref:Glycoside hydrolase family 47 protein n=1 Tax=Macroventuria anomochaeta TaxID=301207 RepID=A0ACB6S4Q6_9PLEO|nr:glycoside hydrolase family 47 protein [Macroventuria anomochaeta]KAF2628615.1 glycoside hydrolase family 47 protein [Macroventuria anomochaeta]
MHSRKGSYGYSLYRSKVQVRWFGSALIVSVTLLLFLRTEFTFWILPRPPRFPSSQTSCPTSPPYPSIIPPPHGRFSWRNVTQHYPVKTFAELPASRKKKLPQVQFDFEQGEPPLYHELMRKRRQAAVKTTFERSWKAYKEHAWKQDELLPISGGSKTTFGGWGATLVDGLDTLWVMGLRDEFHQAVQAVTEIDFAPGDGELNMFETTIRYLGGLLAAYDLTDCKDSRLLEKAMELGDMIYMSFDTPTRMPITRWSAKKAAAGEEQSAAAQGIIAELASFSLEFTRLSQLTGDMRYYDAVKRVTVVLAAQQNSTKIPGLWPVGINVQKPDLTRDNLFSLGTMADSAYEYLGKTYQLLQSTGAATSQYANMYTSAMDAVIAHLLFRPKTPDNADILMPAALRIDTHGTITLDHTAQHLVCFAGGMLALGSKLLGNASHLDYGRKVTDACIWSYMHAPNGIMPEVFRMTPCPTHESCEYDEETSQRQQFPGFERVIDARYMLRPEAIESLFYMYRITGERRYQDVAWSMFEAIERRTRTGLANAAIRDVTLKSELELEDSMESFWMAETLKYFYLIFSEPELLSLDEWVFNTEAHPFRLST